MEEGTLHWNKVTETIDASQWLEVGTVLGEIIDEEDEEGVDEEWKWQAYLHDDKAGTEWGMHASDPDLRERVNEVLHMSKH